MLLGKAPTWILALLLAATATVLSLTVGRVGVVSDLLLAFERKSLDYRMARYRGGALRVGTVPSQIVIVAVDEASLERLGRFSLWPRSYHAQLLERLREAGVRTVAFDFLFSEADVLPDGVRAVRVDEAVRRAGVSPAMAEEVLRGVGGDDALARAMADFGDVWLAGDATTGARPVPVLRDAAAGVGQVSMAPDPDGILRRVRLAGADGSGDAPLAMAAARSFLGGDAPEGWGGGEEVLLDFIGPRGAFLTLSYADVLEGGVEELLLRDRLVFVGVSAAGLGDVFTTPFSEDMPGVEAHATLAYQFVRGHRLRDVPGWAPGLAVAVAVPTALAMSYLGAVAAPLVAAVVAGTFAVANFEAFAQAGLGLPFALPLLAWILAALLAGVHRSATEGRGRREMRRAFGRYVAPDVVDEIARRPELLTVGGESRRITVGFLDIRGFTTLSRSMAPQELARFLHAFFSVVEEEIHARRGTVDKYIGDAVMMLFGAPNELPDGPRLACEAALAICDAVQARQDLWAELGAPGLAVGVGLETGEAVVGNIGSERRFDYTALGDTVNVAARLQDLNKPLGSTILVGEGTRREVEDGFRFQARGRHDLRGRPDPVDVYELVSADDEPRKGPA